MMMECIIYKKWDFLGDSIPAYAHQRRPERQPAYDWLAKTREPYGLGTRRVRQRGQMGPLTFSIGLTHLPHS